MQVVQSISICPDQPLDENVIIFDREREDIHG